MKSWIRAGLAAICFMVMLLTAACSSKPFLIVNYQLPPSTDAPDPIRTSLNIVDLREPKSFLTENARKSLKEFNETYSLVVLQSDGSGNLLGIYNIEQLMTEIFKKRLENSGLQVVPDSSGSVNTLEIKLKEFKLDLAGRKWVVTMSYQASLLKNGQFVATESVNGSAERLKLTGKGDAEKMLGELISDMVNKLDVPTIFERAER